MALTPSLSYSERNDNKLLTVTDTTTNWGTGGNIAVSAITTLTLDVTITNSEGTETVCDSIDLYELNSLDGSSVQADLVFNLSCDTLGIGAITDELPDGIYEFTYIIDEGIGSEASFNEKLLVEGQVRVDVYDKLRTLNTIYNCKECKSKEILDTIFCYGLLNTLESDGYVAKNEELINNMYVLERLIVNGSTYSW